MTLLRPYAALVVLGLPACAHAPPREPAHPFPLKAEIRWAHDNCKGSLLLSVIEEGGYLDAAPLCAPNLGVHRDILKRRR